MIKPILFTLLIFSVAIFCDDKVKAKAEVKAEAEVKGKNAFKFNQAKAGLAQATKMYAEAKAKQEEAKKIEEAAKPKFGSLAQAIAQAKTKQEVKQYKIEQEKLHQQIQVAKEYKIQAQKQISYAQKKEAYCHHMKGEYYYDNQKYETAMKEFKVSEKTSIHKKSHETYYFMGKIYESKKENKEAQQCYKKAVKIKPDFTLATKALTNIESILGIKVDIGIDIWGN